MRVILLYPVEWVGWCLTKPLLFCGRYRAAKVILESALLRSMAVWIPPFFYPGSENAGTVLLESSQNNTRVTYSSDLVQILNCVCNSFRTIDSLELIFVLLSELKYLETSI